MQTQHSRNHRTRVPLSCDACRARKLKCNREWPCQNCSARNEYSIALTACKFRGVAAKNQIPISPVSAAPAPAQTPAFAVTPVAPPITLGSQQPGGDAGLRERINDLEDIVKRLIQGQTPQFSSPKSSVELSAYIPQTGRLLAKPGGEGRTVLNEDGRSVYHGSNALQAILDEINDLKDYIVDGNLCPTISTTVDGPSLLFIQPKPIERMISSLPPKPQVDALVSHFFTLTLQASPLGIPPILHHPTFMREYEENWNDLFKTGFIWLGLLFSMLGISMLAYREYGEPPEYQGKSEALLQLYRKRAAQCLQSGDIAKCLPYTVETLRLNVVAEGHRRDENERGLWIMAGVIVRTAINMGYHREPARAVPILQAEYRRRIWYSVISMDEVFSFLGGFPYMTPTKYSDTAEPSNLHDWELTESMTVLPLSRPLSELTPVTYQIVKSRLAQALGRVADFNSGHGSYESLVEIDRFLQNTYHSFPPQMKLAAMDNENALRNMADWSNLSLFVNYLKGTCSLHRRSLTKARVDVRYGLSRDRCISSALEILELQRHLEIHFHKLSQVRQIFTLGAMALFLELVLRQRVPELAASPSSHVLLQAVEKACDCWVKAASAGCDQASTIHHFLERLLSDFQAEGLGRATQTSRTVPPSREASVTSWLPVSTEPLDFEELPSMEFDWASWDTFIGTTQMDSGLEPGPAY